MASHFHLDEDSLHDPLLTRLPTARIERPGPCRRHRSRQGHQSPQRELRPDARVVRRLQQGLRRALEGQDRRQRQRQAVAWRFRQAGALGHRRAGCRRGDAGPRLRRGRAGRQGQADPRRLAEALATQQLALHLDHRVPGAQGQSQGHQGLGRSRQAGRIGGHAQPQDLGRRALELSCGLGLRAEEVRQRRQARAGLRGGAVRQRTGARFRRTGLAHHLHRARRRRRVHLLGERGLPGDEGTRSGQVPDRGALPEHPGRAAGDGGRQDGRAQGLTRGGHGLPAVPLHPGRPGDRGAELLPADRPHGRSEVRQAVHQGLAVHHRRTSSVAGPRRRRRTSPTAECSTRSTRGSSRRDRTCSTFA